MLTLDALLEFGVLTWLVRPRRRELKSTFLHETLQHMLVDHLEIISGKLLVLLLLLLHPHI